jgi:hypothetical protein
VLANQRTNVTRYVIANDTRSTWYVGVEKKVKKIRIAGGTGQLAAARWPAHSLAIIGNHVACDPTYARCVPQAVHDKLATALAPKYAGDRQAAKDALQAWYPTVWKTLAADFVMPDAFKFWQARFDEHFASKDDTPRAAKSSAPGADQTAEYLRTHRAGGHTS